MRILLVVSLLALGGCVTGYQKYTWSGGYKDKDLGAGRFEVEYYGNGSTSPELVLARWKQRAGELCPGGYSVIEDEPGENTATTPIIAGSAVVPLSVSHPYVKGQVQCSEP